MIARLDRRRVLRGAMRAIAWATAVAAVVALAVVAAALVTGELPGGGAWSVVPVVAGAAVAVIAWAPLRRWASAATDRILHGGRRSPDDVVRSFAGRSQRDVPVDEVLLQLAESLLHELDAAAVHVWRHDGRGRFTRSLSIPAGDDLTTTPDERTLRVLASGGVVGRAWVELWHPELLAGLPEGDARVVPAAHAGTVLALVAVARRPGAPRIDAASDAALGELGTRLGVVLHNRELDATLQDTLADLRRTNGELRASRARLVATADAERRRLERDLHDGAQQHLVALAVNLRLATSSVVDDPSAAVAVLESLHDDVRQAIDELRSLAHGIYPPVLMDAGPVAALRAFASRGVTSVTVTSDGVRRHAPEIEAAVYFCCTEAIQNAMKHAPGAAVRVEIAEAPRTLRFQVDDDGPGLPAAPIRPGHGLGNIVDRLGALGGTLSVGSSDSGGTRIVGTIPVPRDTDVTTGEGDGS